MIVRGAWKRDHLTPVTDPGLPLRGLTFALVGPGRVGTSLASWLVARGAACAAVAGRPGSPAVPATAAALAARTTGLATWEGPEVELLLLAVPDAELPAVARRLAGQVRARVALHVAGALGAGVLAPLAATGIAVGTFHPLRAFPAVEPDPAAAAGCFFALDGDPRARSLGRRLAEALGGESAVVPEEARTIYHLAATLAAGGVATVLAAAADLARAAALPEAVLRGYGRLAAGALAAARAASHPAAAITGPAARGDLATVDRQLAELARVAPRLTSLVVALARTTLESSAAQAPLSAAQQALADRLARHGSS